MDIILTKISDLEHSVRIKRADGTEESAVLNSRSFLRHDLAHLVVESELLLARGYWGSVAQGASLAGTEIRGPDIVMAESLAGPVQTLMRQEADVDEFYATLVRILQPEVISQELAESVCERGRKLQGHWRATPYGGDMIVKWHELG